MGSLQYRQRPIGAYGGAVGHDAIKDIVNVSSGDFINGFWEQALELLQYALCTLPAFGIGLSVKFDELRDDFAKGLLGLGSCIRHSFKCAELNVALKPCEPLNGPQPKK